MTRTTLELGPPSPNFSTIPAGGRLASAYDSTCNRPTYTADLQWNRASNLEPLGSDFETLPPRPCQCQILPTGTLPFVNAANSPLA
ncbi:hypothetical protein AVEN_120531-1 [Araneus ventricosus]|uniref:Uncharacterized protein n=1 Tax=Araneus ventricosus TaxID=182803 RepID=A0A4Y2W2T5_ARAVE|nr:hypothetical protein AVEN_120531-1 [Araneus ventricosus]